jgi:tetratricopeptide (TPR) repeat protein
MKQFFLLLIFSMIFFATGCSHQRISIKTRPENADVYLRANDRSPLIKIGQTPLQVSEAELRSKYGIDSRNNSFCEFVVEKENYASQNIFVPFSSFGQSNAEIIISLKKFSEANLKTADKLIQFLLNSQKFAQEGDFDRALKEVDKTIEINANFKWALAMRGAIYYLKKDYSESLNWYQKALEIDPGFEDAISMISLIKKTYTPKVK